MGMGFQQLALFLTVARCAIIEINPTDSHRALASRAWRSNDRHRRPFEIRVHARRAHALRAGRVGHGRRSAQTRCGDVRGDSFHLARTPGDRDPRPADHGRRPDRVQRAFRRARRSADREQGAGAALQQAYFSDLQHHRERRADRRLGDDEVLWHSDTSYRDFPPSASVLHALEIPPAGGNTAFPTCIWRSKRCRHRCASASTT